MERQNLIEDLFAYFEIDKGRFYKSENTWNEFYKNELLKAFQYGAYYHSTGRLTYQSKESIENMFATFYDLFHNTALNEDETED
jgi:hypothetical protein